MKTRVGYYHFRQVQLARRMCEQAHQVSCLEHLHQLRAHNWLGVVVWRVLVVAWPSVPTALCTNWLATLPIRKLPCKSISSFQGRAWWEEGAGDMMTKKDQSN